jgi:hypothetical protein
MARLSRRWLDSFESDMLVLIPGLMFLFYILKDPRIPGKNNAIRK